LIELHSEDFNDGVQAVLTTVPASRYEFFVEFFRKFAVQFSDGLAAKVYAAAIFTYGPVVIVLPCIVLGIGLVVSLVTTLVGFEFLDGFDQGEKSVEFLLGDWRDLGDEVSIV